MRFFYFMAVCTLLLAGCEREEPPVDVKALEEPEVGPRGNIIQDD